MAIKPGDCIIKLKDLEVGFEVIKDWDGRNKEVPRFEPFWGNFLRHVKDTTEWKAGWDAYDKNFEQKLNEFNATYKQTKKWSDRYIKFKTHSDLTFFVLRWT